GEEEGDKEEPDPSTPTPGEEEGDKEEPNESTPAPEEDKDEPSQPETGFVGITLLVGALFIGLGSVAVGLDRYCIK
ncbi:hypothetical protein, partial [Turicibacter bilis]